MSNFSVPSPINASSILVTVRKIINEHPADKHRLVDALTHAKDHGFIEYLLRSIKFLIDNDFIDKETYIEIIALCNLVMHIQYQEMVDKVLTELDTPF